MKVVLGCPVAERAWILQYWLDSVVMNASVAGVDYEIVCLTTPSMDGTDEILHDAKVTVLPGPSLTRERARIDGHLWGDQSGEIAYMAELRNLLLGYVRDETDADWFFSWDSDIIIPIDGLLIMLEAAGHHDAEAVAPLVDLNKENESGQNPSWNYRWRANYGWDEDLPQYSLANRHGVSPLEVDALMAAMLIKRSSMDLEWAYHPQGEDLAWCAAANRERRRLVLVPEVRTEHVMRH